jgi:hypothetical protein
MEALLVLGLIPGTNIQISFTAWLIMLALSPFFYKYAWPHIKPHLLDYSHKTYLELNKGLMVLMWVLMLTPTINHWPPYSNPSHRQGL